MCIRDSHQVGDYERAAAVLVGDIREAPDVSQAHGGPDRRQDEHLAAGEAAPGMLLRGRAGRLGLRGHRPPLLAATEARPAATTEARPAATTEAIPAATSLLPMYSSRGTLRAERSTRSTSTWGACPRNVQPRRPPA